MMHVPLERSALGKHEIEDTALPSVAFGGSHGYEGVNHGLVPLPTTPVVVRTIVALSVSSNEAMHIFVLAQLNAVNWPNCGPTFQDVQCPPESSVPTSASEYTDCFSPKTHSTVDGQEINSVPCASGGELVACHDSPPSVVTMTAGWGVEEAVIPTR